MVTSKRSTRVTTVLAATGYLLIVFAFVLGFFVFPTHSTAAKFGLTFAVLLGEGVLCLLLAPVIAAVAAFRGRLR
jgi:hypothetical protein